ncbi:MAG: putative 4-hydroxybenzoate polyprenyltransferase [Chitinophagales bacterium]|nr:putative 4-hydroxybenzoate polyprenyltransferase [Chitinophagales bacterium]MDW8428475.1 UbiA-like polyprenyltransferase [Chitinophagales bacterium]
MKHFFALVAFNHTVFALPFALAGYFFAVIVESYTFSWHSFLLVVLCMVLARTSAMAFNRYADAAYDAANPRTRHREIPAGKVSRQAALALALGCALAFWLTTYFINTLCFLLAPVALLVILGYSYTKRFTAWSHLVLGLALSLAPVGAYLAVTGRFGWMPLLLGLAVLLWVAGFDIMYALQDRAFDRNAGLHSLPVRIGATTALRISEIFHVLSAVVLAIAGLTHNLGLWYWLGWLAFAALLVRQHLLVSADDLTHINAAFFTTNGLASVIFCAFMVMDFLWAY